MLGLIRVVLIGLLLGAVFVFLKRLFNKRLPHLKNKPSATSQRQKMQPCAQCGVYLPESDAILQQVSEQPRFFCSDEHRIAYQRDQADS